MKLYVVYDRATGQVVHTHASYVLGNADPVSATEDEVRASMPQALSGRNLGVAQAPEGFDVRSRVHRLEVDTATGEVRLAYKDRPGPERGHGGESLGGSGPASPDPNDVPARGKLEL